MSSIADLPADQIDLSDELFWLASDREREAAFATLRRDKPVSWQREMESPPPVPAGPGFWAVTRFADVEHVSRHPDLFISGKGSNIADLPVTFTPKRRRSAG